MARKITLKEKKNALRAVIGGVLLASVVVAGLAVLLLFGAEYKSGPSDDFVQEILFRVFVPTLQVQDDPAGTGTYVTLIACALVALTSAFCAITRREWTLTWVGSFFGTAFGPLAAVGIYLIGTSDLYFKQDSISAMLTGRRDEPYERKDPFLAVVAVAVTALFIGGALSAVIFMITDNLAFSILIQVGLLLMIYLLVISVHSKLHDRKTASA